MRMIMLALLAMCASGCAGLSPPATILPPAQVADATVIDERAGIAVEQVYRAANLLATVAVDAGLIRGDLAGTVAALDRRAFAAVEAVRAAYRAGNADDYAASLADARGAISALMRAVTGEIGS